MNADIPDDVCVACDSQDLTVIGQGAYRCNACGYEGGSGMAQLMEDERHTGFDAMSPEQRIRTAREDLLHARALLQGAIGSLGSAQSAAVQDLIGLSGSAMGGEIDEKQNLLTTAMGDFEHARRAVLDAAYKLNVPGTVAAFQSDDINFGRWAMDAQGALTESLGDIMMFDTIATARRQVTTLLGEVDDFIGRFPDEQD